MCAVNDIVDAVDIDQSGVSRHLRILYESASWTYVLKGPGVSTLFVRSRSASWKRG
jgi:DNA-binding transcriptional ArsR family regulator